VDLQARLHARGFFLRPSISVFSISFRVGNEAMADRSSRKSRVEGRTTVDGIPVLDLSGEAQIGTLFGNPECV
jgi:hypothetical protein